MLLLVRKAIAIVDCVKCHFIEYGNVEASLFPCPPHQHCERSEFQVSCDDFSSTCNSINKIWSSFCGRQFEFDVTISPISESMLPVHSMHLLNFKCFAIVSHKIDVNENALFNSVDRKRSVFYVTSQIQQKK